jgi:hypothetical protein
MSDWSPTEIGEQITRRRWLLRLGETAALIGISGVVPEAVAELAAEQATQSQSATALPPGLYLPSADHLAHALGNVGNLYISRPGSKTEYAQPITGPYQPQFFSEQDFQIVNRIVETVLGEVGPAALSQTAQWVDFSVYSAAGVLEAAQHLDPLHRAVAVAYYGEAFVRDQETSDPQRVVREGLAAVHQASMARYKVGFLEATAPQQTDLINSIRTAQAEDPLRQFFDLIRSETIRGYYTSAEGLKELNYKGNTFHGQCPGCAAQ